MENPPRARSRGCRRRSGSRDHSHRPRSRRGQETSFVCEVIVSFRARPHPIEMAPRPRLTYLFAALFLCLGKHVAAQGTARTIDWPAYAHDAGGTKFSPARQIDRRNVKNLVPIWTYRTGDYALGGGMARDETTPLFVDNVLYASTPFGGVRALDPETGAELWSFDSELDLSGGYGDFTNRGVSTWLDATRPVGADCRRRIYVAPV